MARVNITVTPVRHLGGKPWVGQLESGERYAPVKLSIGTGQTYTTADTCALVHEAGSDFKEHFGARTIKMILSEPFACNNFSTGLLKLYWDTGPQRARLRIIGQGGGGSPAGPRADGNLTDGTALGSGTMTANAVIFWGGAPL